MAKKVTILFFLISFANLLAQKVINYTTENGLPSNHIYDIQQDINGFMWFATNRGLVKFNGESFKTFTIKDGLPNNDTWLLDTDFQGRLWYFSKSKYQGYILNDSIYKFPNYKDIVISPYVSKTNKQLFIIGHGEGEFLNLKGGVFVKDKSTQIEYYTNFEKKYFEKHKNVKKNIFPLYETNEYVIVKKNKLLFFDKESNLIKETKGFIPQNFSYNEKSAFVIGGFIYNNIHYISTYKGLLLINTKQRNFNYFAYDVLVKKKVKDPFIKAFKNEIQVSMSGHLFIFNYNMQLVDAYVFSEQIKNHKSFRDKNGNLWLADLGQGITFISKTQNQTSYYLKNKLTKKLCFIGTDLFVGVEKEGFFKYNFVKDSFVFQKQLNKTTSTISQMSYDATLNKGYFLSGKSHFMISKEKTLNFPSNYKTDSITFNFNAIKSAVSLKNDIYLSSIINVAKLDSIGIVTNIIKKTGLQNSTSHKNKVFFGATDGLYYIENDTLIKVININDLVNVSVLSFSSLENYLVVGTDGRGLYLYNKKQLISIKSTEGLSIQKIIKKNNAFWLASQKGVQILSLDKQDFSRSKITNSFYKSDGLLQNNSNDIAIKNDTLYVASDIGIAKLAINDSIYKIKPQLYFKEQKDTLNINKKNSISISFATLDFNNQKNINYAYRLLPIQKAWISTTTKTLNFSNLAPKLYQLEVKATDQHNNKSVKKKYINIIPPWWNTIWVKVIFSWLIFLLLALVFKYLNQYLLKKKQDKLCENQRFISLELQALRSQMNPHFVHNSLNAIQYYIQRNEIDLSEKYLVKFSQLIRLFFEYSRRKNISIYEEVSLLTNYLQIEQLRFEEKLKFTIKIDKEIDVNLQLIPSMVFQPIVENAVNHGLFHKKTNGQINIHFKYIDENTMMIKIKDDGIGIKKAKKLHEHSVKNYQSHSSEILQERLKLLQQSKEWKIDYKIEDLSDSSENTGTLVQLTFKQI